MIGKIYISGLIGSTDDQRGVELIDVVQQVKSQPQATSFDVFINSEGGDVQVGFDIYNYLKSLPYEITTIGTGVVASIASVIFLAGDKRIVMDNCWFMIHLPMGNPQWLTAEQMLDYAKEVRNVETQIIDFYTSNINIEKEALIPLLKNETVLTKEQLQLFGFLTEQEPLKIVAKANINFQNKKKMDNKTEKWLKKIFKAISSEKKVVNLMLLTAEEKELDFFELKDGEMIVIGSKARIDGKDADGEIVLKDGRTFIFDKGTLTEIKDIPNEDANVEEMTAKIVELEKQVEAIQAKYQKTKEKLKKKQEIISRIEQLRSKFEKDEKKINKGKKSPKKESKFQKAITNLKQK